MSAKVMYMTFAILLFFLESCIEPKIEDIPNGVSMSNIEHTEQDIYDLGKKVIEGDTGAYYKLAIIYMPYHPGNFLYWALIMANKNKYPLAYLDVFQSVCHGHVKDKNDFQKIDEQTQKFALEYLRIAAGYGLKEAIDILQRIENDKDDDSQKPPHFDNGTIKKKE